MSNGDGLPASNGDGLPTVFRSRCAVCGLSVGWVEVGGRRWIMVDEDLGPHWATCPEVARLLGPGRVSWSRRGPFLRLPLTPS